MSSCLAQRIAQRAFLVAVVLSTGLGTAWAQGKTAVPDATAQARAQELIRDVYGKEYDTAKTSAQRIELARKLLDQATDSRQDPASHFVLLRVAKNVAVLAGDAETAIEALDRIVDTYDVDPMEMRLDCLQAAARAAKLSSHHGVIAQKAFSSLEEALAEDDFEAAGQFAEIAQESAKRARDYTLLKQVIARMKGVEEIQKAHAEYQKFVTRLEESPIDPEANLAAGRYLCLEKGDWERGVSMLALGSDPGLKDLAVKELDGAASPDAQIALGDGWWDLAQTQKGREQESLLLRAGHWYGQAQPKVTSGLKKVRLDQRLEEIAKIKTPAGQVGGARVRARQRSPANLAGEKRRTSTGRVATRRIDFRRPDAAQQFILSRRGSVRWDAKEGAMIISGKGGLATYAEHFRSISSVTIRGMIVPPSEHCFRIGVGPISLLFNWEGGSQNRFHVGQSVTQTEPYALTPGKMHEVRVVQEGDQAVITFDEKQHHTVTARLEGTVTVYTNYGNTIKVSEIVIEGVPEPGVRVAGPSHRLY